GLDQVRRLAAAITIPVTNAAMQENSKSSLRSLAISSLGHRPMGGKFFRNHINFHHVHYCKDHLVSRTYLGDEGNNTPFFFIPVFLVGACTYLVCRLLLEKKKRKTAGIRLCMPL